MNEPGILAFTAYRNDSFQNTITVTDGSNVAISLASADVKMQIRTRPDGDVKMTLTEGDGITVGGAGNNVITISRIMNIDQGGRYYYDIQAAFTDGTVQTYLRGPFVLIEDITL
jgi:hypothetical protein